MLLLLSLLTRTISLILITTFLLLTPKTCSSFTATTPPPSKSPTKSQSPFNNILILDHLNINHQKGRHDLLKAFYFDFLKCGVDPRKAENLEKGKKTLWANIGAQQFHLPEGKPNAQVLNGLITLYFPNVLDIVKHYEDNVDLIEMLKGSEFHLELISNSELRVCDPWGTTFKLLSTTDEVKDARGIQGGHPSLGICMKDLTFYVPKGTNFAGIGRFYDQIFHSPILNQDENVCVVSMGPYQTLTFQTHPGGGESSITHVDLREEPENNPTDKPFFVSNYGPHISIYIKDIRSTYNRAKDLGVVYVNPRFSRKAYNEEEVVDDCMFRCLDIVDPDNVAAGTILSLEHEVRSVVKRNGELYKSCPFDAVQDGCVV